MQVLLSVFNWVLISSAMAIVPACIILLVKSALKNRLGAGWHYYIWLLLVVRLLLPYSPQSPFSIYNFTNQTLEILPVYQDAYKPTGEKEFIAESTEKEAGTPSGPRNYQISAKENVGNPVWAAFNRQASAYGLPKFAMVWLAGLLIFLLYTAFINIALYLKIRKSGQLADGPTEDLLDECKLLMDINKSIPILVSMSVNTPALIGIFRPKILLPAKIVGELDADELKYVFLHELAHYRRKDILFVWLTVIIRALHWFNPLVWYCFYRMDQDREAACDAMVLSRVKPEERLKYGHTIIHLLKMLPSLQKPAPGVIGILPGKARIKRRLAMISLFKKESVPWTVAIVILILSVSFICLTSAKNGNGKYAGTEAEYTKLSQELIALQNTLQKQNEENKALVDLTTNLKEQLKNYEMLAGKADIKGKGIIVTLRDNTGDGKNNVDRSTLLLLVHDADIRNIVNELSSAGAEAISVNDERLVATSEIKADGSVILINNNKLTSPFIIKAIGDPDILERTLKMREGVAEHLQAFGLLAAVEKPETLIIPMYKGELQMRYAQPAKSFDALEAGRISDKNGK